MRSWNRICSYVGDFLYFINKFLKLMLQAPLIQLQFKNTPRCHSNKGRSGRPVLAKWWEPLLGKVFLGEETITHSSQSDTVGRAGREGLGFNTSPQAVLPKRDRTGNVTIQHNCQPRPGPSAMSCRENKLKKWFLKLPLSQGTVEASPPTSECPLATAAPTASPVCCTSYSNSPPKATCFKAIAG